jgi:hypothetical protein
MMTMPFTRSPTPSPVPRMWARWTSSARKRSGPSLFARVCKIRVVGAQGLFIRHIAEGRPAVGRDARTSRPALIAGTRRPLERQKPRDCGLPRGVPLPGRGGRAPARDRRGLFRHCSDGRAGSARCAGTSAMGDTGLTRAKPSENAGVLARAAYGLRTRTPPIAVCESRRSASRWRGSTVHVRPATWHQTRHRSTSSGCGTSLWRIRTTSRLPRSSQRRLSRTLRPPSMSSRSVSRQVSGESLAADRSRGTAKARPRRGAL